MSNYGEEDETQIEPEVDGIEEDDFEEGDDRELMEPETMFEEEPGVETTPGAEPVNVPTKKREKREPVVFIREPGKTLLPFARVQKIIKADKVNLPSIQASQVADHDILRRKYQ